MKKVMEKKTLAKKLQNERQEYFYRGYSAKRLAAVWNAIQQRLAEGNNEFCLKNNGLTILIFQDEFKCLITDEDLNNITEIYKSDAGLAFDYEVAIAVIQLGSRRYC